MLENLEILPPALKFEKITPTYGKLYLEPLERGYGMTLGNALRRVLLSSIQGAAITSVRFDGVLHEFSTIPGVREDVIEILMNLKHVPVRSRSKEVRIITLDIRKDKAGVVTAADLPDDPELDFIDPNAKICTMEDGAHLVMDLYIEQGVGYLSAERPRSQFLPVDCLLADAVFSPVLRVNYNVEAARVGQRTDYERLAMEIWTNGVISPDEAVGEASRIIETYFGHIVNSIEDPQEGMMPEEEPPEAEDEEDTSVPEPTSEEDGALLNHSVRELELSIRSENSLMRGGIHTIGDLLQKSRDDLLNIRNLGKKSLIEIEKKITRAGLTLREKKAEQEGSAEGTPEAVQETQEEVPAGESPEQESSGNNEKEE